MVGAGGVAVSGDSVRLCQLETTGRATSTQVSVRVTGPGGL